MRFKPGWISAHLALSRTLLLQGEVDKALDECHRLLEQDPGEQDVIAMEATILEHIGDAYEAVGDMENAEKYRNMAREKERDKKRKELDKSN